MQPPTETIHTPVVRVSTDNVASHEAFDAWQAIIGSAYTIGAEREGFHGAARIAALDRMVVQTMDAAPQSVARNAKQIRRDGLEHFTLHLNWHGFGFSSPRREGRLHPGQISISDLARPFERSIASDRDSTIVSLKRELVEGALAGPADLHGLVLSDSMGDLLGEHMRMLTSRIGCLPAASARSLSEATAALLAAAVGGTRDTRALAQPSLDAARVLLAKKHIRAHLHRLDLTADTIARAIRVSRRTLFALFEPEGGVERYVLRRRLAAAADALRDPRETRTIAGLAHAHGFVSVPHFARAFRARYGLTAGEMRAEQQTGLLTTNQANLSAFEQWLRRLG